MNGLRITAAPSLLALSWLCIWPSERAAAVPCGSQNPPVCIWNNGGGGGFPLNFQLIDFEHLPDGSPSHGGVEITPSFNYAAQGVTFSAPYGNPFIAGSMPGDFSIEVDSHSPLIRDWITADFVTPVRGVGVYFPGETSLSAYDMQGNLIGRAHYSNSGVRFFVGITSDTPIARAIMDRSVYLEDVDDFLWVPVPEPASALLIALGAAFIVRARRGRP